jgi:hypothetical protein
MEVDEREVSLIYNGRTRDFLFRLLFSKSDVPASCADRDFSPDIDRSDLVNRASRSETYLLPTGRTFRRFPMKSVALNNRR